MTTHVIGLTGWWSKFIPFFQRPIKLPFAQLRGTPDMRLAQYAWSDWQKAVDDIRANYVIGDKTILLGHSYGASAATKIAARLATNGLSVHLFISEDQGLDSLVIKDVPIGGNVHQVDEYQVAFERLTFASNFAGQKMFFDVSNLPGGHTTTFTKPAFVKRIVRRIREVHRQ